VSVFQALIELDEPLGGLDEPLVEVDEPRVRLDEPRAGLDETLADLDETLIEADELRIESDETLVGTAERRDRQDVISVVIAYALHGFFAGWSPIFAIPRGLAFEDPLVLPGFAILGMANAVAAWYGKENASIERIGRSAKTDRRSLIAYSPSTLNWLKYRPVTMPGPGPGAAASSSGEPARSR